MFLKRMVLHREIRESRILLPQGSSLCQALITAKRLCWICICKDRTIISIVACIPKTGSWSRVDGSSVKGGGRGKGTLNDWLLVCWDRNAWSCGLLDFHPSGCAITSRMLTLTSGFASLASSFYVRVCVCVASSSYYMQVPHISPLATSLLIHVQVPVWKKKRRRKLLQQFWLFKICF